MNEPTDSNTRSPLSRLAAAVGRRIPRRPDASDAAGQIRAARYQAVADLAVVIAFLVAVSGINLALGGNGWFTSALGLNERWDIVGVVPGFVALVVGMWWFAWRRTRYASMLLAEREQSEADERSIAAIGLGASWDLDLSHIYARFANDLRSLIEYDRFAIITSRADGRVEVVFAQGVCSDQQGAGSLIPPESEEPDGLKDPEAAGFRACLTAPIGGPAQLPGRIVLRSHSEGAYGEREADLFRRVVAHTSLAVTNARLFEATLRRVRERTALAEIGRAATADLDQKSIYEEIRRAMSGLVRFDRVECALIDRASGRAGLVWTSGVEVPGLSVGDDIGWQEDSGGEASARHREALSAAGLESWIETPLIARERTIGLFVLRSRSESAYGEDDQLLMRQIASQIAPAIENARLYAEAQREAKERTALAAVGLAVNSDLDIQRIYEGVAEELARLLQYDRLIVLLMNDEREMEVSFVQGVPLRDASVGDSIAGRPGANTDLNAISREGMSSAVRVPLGGLGTEFGYLIVGSLAHDAYTGRDEALLGLLAAHIAPAIVNSKLLTQERDLRGQIATQNEELQAANDAKNRFLSQVSHELKTPLTIVSGFLDLLVANDEANLSEDQLETLGVMRGNAQRLGLLINDLLDLSRIDVGRFTLDKAEFDASELFREIKLGFEPVLSVKNQILLASWPEESTWIEADRQRLAQVTTNLLTNASKYSPDDTKIELTVTVTDGRLRATVRDSGIGIAEEDQEKLFTQFYRVEGRATRGVPGTGLGLAIAKSIIDLHGGTISLASAPDAGTTVYYEIPGVMAAPSEDYLKGEPGDMAAAPRSRLATDDEPQEMELSAG